MRYVLLALILVLAMVACAQAVPVQDTTWGKASLRIEMRPYPIGFPGGLTPAQTERLAKENGVGGRWIGVFGFYDSSISTDNHPEFEQILKDWIADIHKLGMPVVSIYPLIFSKSAWKDHPEWRQRYIVPAQLCAVHGQSDMCFNTGYGDYLIDLSNEAIDKLGLDGIWFDCALWTPYCYPMGVTCNCDSCKRLFKQQTGLDIPAKVDWDDPVFRKWVAWRYDSFAAYIKRLADGIRKKHPNAAVMINHLHRPGGLPWQTGIPLNPFNADVITGSEGTGEGIADLVMRLCRAYGRPQSEVWTSLDFAFTGTGANPDTSAATDQGIHHALTCATAGGMPSFGGPHDNKAYKVWKHISSVLDPVHPYITPNSVPYAALHVSQQSETFYFGRERQGISMVIEPYWKSILGWTQGMMAGHIAPDYVYDKSLTAETLRKYPVLLLPMSQALSTEQCRRIVNYVRSGGTAVLGIGAGACDEWGTKRKANPLQRAFDFRFESIPSPAATELRAVTLLDRTGRTAGSFNGLYSPLHLGAKSWQVMYSSDCDGARSPAVASRRFGKGSVMVVGVDSGAASIPLGLPVVGGDATIAVSDETAASGRHSLRFSDGPNAPQSFYPDLEVRFPAVRSSSVTEGRLRFALRVEPGAQPMVEMRGQKPKVCAGPSILVNEKGDLTASGRKVCHVEHGKWYAVDVKLHLGGSVGTYDIGIKAPGSTTALRGIPYADPKIDDIDWIVISGAGKEKSAFYIDDIRLDWLTTGKQTITQILDGFESTPVGTTDPISPFTFLAKDILRMTPAPVEVDGPDFIRMGAYRRNESETIVHLHNLHGGQIRPVAGSSVTIRTRTPVKSAVRALTGTRLELVRERGWSVIHVPSVSLHEVVLLRR